MRSGGTGVSAWDTCPFSVVSSCLLLSRLPCYPTTPLPTVFWKWLKNSKKFHSSDDVMRWNLAFTCVWLAGVCVCQCAIRIRKGPGLQNAWGWSYVLTTVRPRRANLQVIRPLPRHLLLFQTLYLQIYSEKANSYEALFYATSVYYSCLDSLNEQSESILPNYEKELDTILLVASIPCVFCFLALCERKLSP